MQILRFETHRRCEMLDITASVRDMLREHPQWKQGALALFCPHTTCGLTVNEGADPDVKRDMVTFFNRVVPENGDYHHVEGNSDAHIKTSLHGPALMLLVEDGDICLGTWQSVYLCEGDGPRHRSLWLQWLPGEKNS